MSIIESTGIVLTPEFSDALARLERGEDLFLTGRAGTGKSTLIRQFLSSTQRNTIVAAPTGIAALNVGGYTIHRLFSFSSGVTIEHVRSNRYYPSRFDKAIAEIDTLIIDEASMVRADLFDCLALALERFGPEPGTPFGGVQIVLVGDLYQLPPVVTESEASHFTSRYESPFFFSADHYETAQFHMVELTTVFRQIGDTRLIDILNAVRDGQVSTEVLDRLNRQVIPGYTPPIEERWVTLTTTNRIANTRNQAMLDKLQSPLLCSEAVTSGDLDGFDEPSASKLTYKVGAQVMMLTNDFFDRWVNGTLAEVIADEEVDGVHLVTVRLPGGQDIEVQPHTWDVVRPTSRGGSLHHEVVGTFTQLPFRLSWAITVHKSQGQTLDRCVVDLSGGTFADGQLYVALSRCISLEGLVLAGEVKPKDLKVSQRIRRFLRSRGAETSVRGKAFIGVCEIGDSGFSWRPRPVEIAVLTEDGTEISTLVNPGRDPGTARSDFGISAADLQLAPTLAEAWAALVPLLDGRIPVGVNIDRTLAHIDFELKRLGEIAPIPVGEDIDLTNDIDISEWEHVGLNAPHAIERARAVRQIASRSTRHASADVFLDMGTHRGYLLPRGTNPMEFRVAGLTSESLTPAQLLAEHLRSRVPAAQSDRRVRSVLQTVEQQSGMPLLDGELSGDPVPSIADTLTAGARVCFTGATIDRSGNQIPKARLHELASTKELEPVTSVSKSGCDVLISAEAGSQSNKAKAALKFGKPIYTAAEFLAWVNGDEIPAQHLDAHDVAVSITLTRVAAMTTTPRVESQSVAGLLANEATDSADEPSPMVNHENQNIDASVTVSSTHEVARILRPGV